MTEVEIFCWGDEMTVISKWLSGGSALALAGSALIVPQTAFAQNAPETVSNTVLNETDDRPVIAMGGTVGSYSSSVDPLRGLIRAFEGDLDPYIGRIRAFEGGIDPAMGRIRAFEGDIDPYRGLIRAFWGDLAPVAGEIDPSIGRIRAFTDSFVPSSSEISAAWTLAEQTQDYTQVTSLLNGMISQSAQEWQGQVQQITNSDFKTAVQTPFLAKWNVQLDQPETLAGWALFDRQAFLLDWYDTVLNYSGMDRYDHWMNAVRWTPAITQIQGGGSDAVIGLVDFFAANDADVRSKVVYSGGYTGVNNAHGAAVGSLIVASHDGKGVMGIAPRAKVAAYNPFDSSMTANWADVRAGISAVGSRGASVINLSLGVEGFTLPSEWRDVFKTSAIDSFKDKTIYVIAAGNDGSVQTSNIDMSGALDSTFLIVGSVDPLGRISAFSNTPGTACITVSAKCENTAVFKPGGDKFSNSDYLKESGLLMNRFLVAPGEMLLVSDGAGGVTRMSGTSFAAPLVSGAIALIQDRWPWLKNHPRDVAKIILESAQDLGAPGVDAVYGHGLLDIEAAQSALDFNKLKYYAYDGAAGNKKNGKEVNAKALLAKGVQASWAGSHAYFTAFEEIDSAERDFLIPLSSRLFDQSVNGRAFQSYMYDLFMTWVSGNAGFQGGANGLMPTKPRFASLTDNAKAGIGQSGNGWSYAMKGRFMTRETRFGLQPGFSSSLEVAAPDGFASFAVGSGDGALSIAGNGAMQLSSDFNPLTGGNDPLLGFASGDAHMSAKVKVAPNLRISFGLTNNRRDIENDFRNAPLSEDLISQQRLLGDYEATALNVRFDRSLGERTNVSVALTQLHEARAMLGVRSLSSDDFGKGTVSRSATLSSDTMIGDSLQLFASATVARTSSDRSASFRLAKMTSTAWQVGFAKSNLLGSNDNLRFTLAQPLQIEAGQVEFSSIGVVNRETGERGVITQRFDIADPARRRIRAEAHYGAAMADGKTNLALFSSMETRNVRSDIARWTVGGQFRTRF